MSYSKTLEKIFDNQGSGPKIDPNKIPFATSTSSDSSTEVASTEWVRDWYENELLLPSSVYVDPVNGDNTNSGISANDAFKTIRYALDFIYGSGKIQNGFKNIHLAAGEYDENAIEGLSNNDIYIEGPSSGYAIVNGFDVANGQKVRIGGNIGFTTDHCIECKRHAFVYLTNGVHLNFNSWSGKYIIYSFQGGHVYGVSGSTFNISFTGTSGSCSNALLTVANNSEISNYGNVVWSGNCTGKKYSVYRMGFLYGMNTANMPSGTTDNTPDSTSVVYG